MDHDTLSLESFRSARSHETVTETVFDASETNSMNSDVTETSQITTNSAKLIQHQNNLIQSHLADQNPLLYKHLSQHGMIEDDVSRNSEEIDFRDTASLVSPRGNAAGDNTSRDNVSRDNISRDNVSKDSISVNNLDPILENSARNNPQNSTSNHTSNHKLKNLEKFILDKKMQFNFSPVYKTKELTNLVEFTTIISQACHILCLLLPIIIAYLVQPGSSSFSWHPFLMTTTYSFINLQAILIFTPERLKPQKNNSKTSRTNPMVISDELNSSQDSIPLIQNSSSSRSSKQSSSSRSEKVNFHLLLNFVGIILSTIAFIIIWRHKSALKKRHLSSLHGVLGFVTLVINYVQLLLGVPMKSAFFRQKIFSFIKPVKLRLVHACVGLLVIVLASATQVAAFYSQWFNNSISSSRLNKLLISLIPISQAFIIMNQVTNRYLLPNFNYYQKSTLF